MVKTALTISTVFVLFLGTAAAQPRIAADLGAGTTGISANLQLGLNNYIALRSSYNYLSWTLEDEEYDDISYDADLDFSTLGTFVDLHPFGNGWTISAGALFGEKSLSLDATPTTNVEIGSATFTPAEVGILTGSVDLEDTAPYVGFGFDNLLTNDARIGVAVRLGLMMTGNPTVELDASGGTLSNDPIFQTQLAEEEENLQSDIDQFELFPVVSFAIGMKF